MSVVEMIKKGGIYIDRFLQPDSPIDPKEKVDKYEYDALYQPTEFTMAIDYKYPKQSIFMNLIKALAIS